MSRNEVLRSLFLRLLREHGDNAPALIDICIEGVAPRLWVAFSNGDHIYSDLLEYDVFAFREQYSVWDLAGLGAVLLSDAQRIYAQMQEAHRVESLRETRRRFVDRVRHLSYRIAQSFREQREIHRVRGLFTSCGSLEARLRSMQLLKEALSPAQRRLYEKYWYFDVTGGNSGTFYRIRHGRSMNVDELDTMGRRVRGWCFHPRGDLMAGDVMLTQKLALELFEVEALKVANRIR